MPQSKKAFTLIELLVVIVIIGILAGILISSMVSATNSANDARRKADINQLVKAIAIIKTQDGLLPTESNANCKLGSTTGSENCSGIQGKLATQGITIPTDPNGNYYTYNRVSADDFTLTGTLSSEYTYTYNSSTSNYSSLVPWSCGNTLTDSRNAKTYNTVQIGTQCWMKENMDYNNDCASVTWVNSTDNGWCGYYTGGPFTNEGLLYQWSAAMNGSTTEGAQGICPTGWHVPTDTEWNTLEKYTVGVIDSATSQYACDTTITGWRRCADDSGTNAGGSRGAGKSLKKVGQGSGVGAGDDLIGFSSLLPGDRNTDGTFSVRSSSTYIWSSSPFGVSAWARYLNTTYSTVARSTDSKAIGFSVRCLKN